MGPVFLFLILGGLALAGSKTTAKLGRFGIIELAPGNMGVQRFQVKQDQESGLPLLSPELQLHTSGKITGILSDNQQVFVDNQGLTGATGKATLEVFWVDAEHPDGASGFLGVIVEKG